MKTYREVLNNGIAVLEQAGVPDAAVDGWYLFSECFHMSRTEYWMRQCEDMIESEKLWETWKSFLSRRCGREPLQYILGMQEFMGMSFFVTPDVLIPRQDTEVLVEKALSFLRSGDCLLDVCTGSGCILLSLAKSIQLFRCVGVDISQNALLVAKKNAKELKIDAEFICSDLFQQITAGEKFHMITCNPPYISGEEMKELMPEVADYEPHLALFGGEDGLFFYRKIIEQAADFLMPDGSLLLEIGCTQAKAVSGMMLERGYRCVEVIKDLAGRDRVAVGVWKG